MGGSRKSHDEGQRIFMMLRESCRRVNHSAQRQSWRTRGFCDQGLSMTAQKQMPNDGPSSVFHNPRIASEAFWRHHSEHDI